MATTIFPSPGSNAGSGNNTNACPEEIQPEHNSRKEGSVMSVSNSSGISSISDQGSMSSDPGYPNSDKDSYDIGLGADSNNCCFTNQTHKDEYLSRHGLAVSLYQQQKEEIASSNNTMDGNRMECRDYPSQVCPAKKLLHESEAFILNPQR